VEICLGPGEEHDVNRAEELLGSHEPDCVIADKGHDSDEFIAVVRQRVPKRSFHLAATVGRNAAGTSENTNPATSRNDSSTASSTTDASRRVTKKLPKTTSLSSTFPQPSSCLA
jgi:hypothetical protein